MSEKQHAKDIKKFEDLHKQGGACLNRHVSEFKTGDTCSHRWQAFEDANDHAELYNWDKYEPLSTQGSVKTSAFVSSGKLWPPWYRQKLAPPTAHAWDVGRGKNFQDKCYVPYWHNAHHMVPNGELRGAIAGCGKGFKSPSKVVWAVREGLLKAAYNLNDKKNMIVLPMDRAIGRVLELPVHLSTVTARSHGAYSKNVRDQLDDLFSDVKLQLKNHDASDPPNFGALKKRIEKLSGHLHGAIEKAGITGVKYLDSMPKASFVPPAR
jgi:hypothetical protein